ncbi:MAG: serine hydrolase [Bacteroidota bacterium]|nr:serine hydrolase [Bacteroidota bacterium]
MLRFTVAFICLFFSSQAQPLPKDFDAYVEKVLKTFNVPGVSVAVVKDGKVVLAKGYGVKTIGTNEKVDTKTNFSIASNTKAFIGTSLGILVDEGKLKWNDRVVDHLPWFQLSDPYVTREMRIIDLLVHRSGLGLGAGDLLIWPTNTYKQKDVVKRFKNIPLASSFRSTYAYDNILYLIAGEVIEAVSGLSWNEFVRTRIFSKLGMNNSTLTFTEAIKKGNVATPHAEINGVVRPVAASDSDKTNPAASINTNADDIAKWLICQIDSGKLSDGTTLFSPATARQLWSIVTPVPVSKVAKELAPLQANFSGYGGGFTVRDYRGKKLVSHTGGLSGFVSFVAFIPEIRAGVAVFTNQEAGGAFYSIGYRALDHYLGSNFDWTSAYKAVKDRGDSLTLIADKKTAASRDSLSSPSLPLTKYAGKYSDAWYGEITIELKEGKLFMQMVPTPSLGGYLEHYQYNTFIARWSDPEMRADAFVTFSLNPDGSIEQAKMKAVSPSTDFSFDFHDLLLKPTK